MSVKLIAPPGKIIITEFEQATPSSMPLPRGEKEEQRLGLIYAFGDPINDDPVIKLKKGQKIIFKKYVSNPFYLAGLDEKFNFIEYDDIVALLEDE